MRGPQITMGSNTNSWSTDLDDLGYPHFRTTQQTFKTSWDCKPVSHITSTNFHDRFGAILAQMNLFAVGDVMKPPQDLLFTQRSKAQLRTPRLQGRNDFAWFMLSCLTLDGQTISEESVAIPYHFICWDSKWSESIVYSNPPNKKDKKVLPKSVARILCWWFDAPSSSIFF